MERGEVDLALARPETAPAATRQRRFYDEEYLVIARQDHPKIKGLLDLNLFCELDHVVVSTRGGGFAAPTDAALEEIGRRRTVSLSTSGFPVVRDIVSQADMIGVVPRGIAEGWSDRVQVLESPLQIPGYTIASILHERTTYHPAKAGCLVGSLRWYDLPCNRWRIKPILCKQDLL